MYMDSGANACSKMQKQSAALKDLNVLGPCVEPANTELW